MVVPGVEHISVLFAGRTHTEVAAWAGGGDGAAPRPAARLVPSGLLLLGFALGFTPLSALLTGHRRVPPERWARGGPPVASAPVVLAVAACATGLGVLLGAVTPTSHLPLAVGGYLTGFLLVTGGLLAAARRWPLPTWPAASTPGVVPVPAAATVHAAAPAPAGGPVPAGGSPGRRAPVRSVVATLLLTGYAAIRRRRADPPGPHLGRAGQPGGGCCPWWRSAAWSSWPVRNW